MLERDQAPVAEDVVIAVELTPVKLVLEVGGHVEQALVHGWLPREAQLLALHQDGRVGEPPEAPGVVEVQV